jgi:hypothetical protein
MTMVCSRLHDDLAVWGGPRSVRPPMWRNARAMPELPSFYSDTGRSSPSLPLAPDQA